MCASCTVIGRGCSRAASSWTRSRRCCSCSSASSVSSAFVSIPASGTGGAAVVGGGAEALGSVDSCRWTGHGDRGTWKVANTVGRGGCPSMGGTVGRDPSG